MIKSQNPEDEARHIVIVGGGAPGLELATKLGDSLGRSRKAKITLVDGSRTHIWKRYFTSSPPAVSVVPNMN